MTEFGVGGNQLESIGLKNLGNVYWNLSTPALYEEIVRRREGSIAHLGPLVVHTGHHTGRSPSDKFIVKEQSCAEKVNWGSINQPLEEEKFNFLFSRLSAFLQGRDIFIQDLFGGADKEYQIPVRVITEYAWHNLFARDLLIQPKKPVRHNSSETFTIIDAPRFHAVPEIDGTKSEVFIVINFAKRLVIIGGTSYAGEIKKSVFTILNYLLPQRNVFPMHCSANIGKDGNVALFFGLSGTGKTTLSADPERFLIGDDEHGWSANGVFNFEGGCYAKVVRLSAEAEPEIFKTTRRFGTVLENVIMNSESRIIDLNDTSLTENTRAAYPLTHIKNRVASGMGGHPKNIIMLTCDAFGVMPPIAKLTTAQARYHFLSGYTAKIAGTEQGVGKDPEVTFSTCFGAPFMPLHPTIYSKMLGEKLSTHNVQVWLINTGWTGGKFGTGMRMKISYTRAMVRAALDGKLNDVPTIQEPYFGFHIPTGCPDVPPEILNPKNTWKDSAEYDRTITELVLRFKKNFEQFASYADSDVVNAGPR